MTNVVIVDYGVGNLRSVQKIFERAGEGATISRERSAIAAADAVVLPGVGAFRDAMDKLEGLDLVKVLRRTALDDRKPFLGICLGMQLLADRSREGGDFAGLGLVPGTAERLDVSGARDLWGRALTLPHIGWNAVTPRPAARLFEGIALGSDFYFAHSYHVVCRDAADVAAHCEYGTTFACALERGNIFGTQFHPEKSQRDGMATIRNFLALCRQRAAA
ncbi:MAG: imidazole glycerol phosphate synthase subunit HisH [Alphaproteobacteria bacterium]|nr:imidazole glycerol phosphate synthase subunit HisH [Alphaproteobacteria bacterium]